LADLLADRATRLAYGRASLALSRRFAPEAQAQALVDLYRQGIAQQTRPGPVS
jgi:hypothetical protein